MPASETPLPSRCALLLLDVQNDFCPGGKLAIANADRIIPRLNYAIERFMVASAPIYAARDWHPPVSSHFKRFGGRWPVHCVAGTPGAGFHPTLRLPAAAKIVSKGQGSHDDAYSAFEGTLSEGLSLSTELHRENISHLYLAGLATDFCVRATALDALQDGFAVTILRDGIAGIDRNDSAQALEQLERAGAQMLTTAQLDRVLDCKLERNLSITEFRAG